MSNDAGYGLTLFDARGRRKYLTLKERLLFLEASKKAEWDVMLFCSVLSLTGCRISEALELTPQQLDAGAKCIVFRTLKRRTLAFRAVPIPAKFMRDLVSLTWTMPRDKPIWPWCRQTAWRRVKTLMATAGLSGPAATPKGLRHGFGVATAEKNIPISILQKWLGHANAETTAIYLAIQGEEERRFAKRLWHDYARL